MKRFVILTKYIAMIESDSIGKWIIDKENDGTPEHPIQMPYVEYTAIVNNFIEDVYAFKENNRDIELTRYKDILEKNGLDWSMKSMKDVEVASLNAECVLALIMGALRADRFNEGVLKKFFNSGSVLRWLERLKEIDESSGANG